MVQLLKLDWVILGLRSLLLSHGLDLLPYDLFGLLLGSGGSRLLTGRLGVSGLRMDFEVDH